MSGSDTALARFTRNHGQIRYGIGVPESNKVVDSPNVPTSVHFS
jgi:hypothetical protein